MERTRVVVVDDQKVARGYLEGILRSSDRYEFVASFSSADAACVYVQAERPDLVLMDVLLREGIDGLEAAERIKAASPETKVIVITQMPEVSYIDRARQAGVESFWYKESSEEPLLAVMDATMAGKSVYPPMAPRVGLGLSTNSDLTAQELVVLRALTTGASNSEIAERLCLSVHTVRTHVRHLLEKTGYETRTKLAVAAVSSGLIVPDFTD